MTVNITFSGTSGGNSLSDTTDLGSHTPGDPTDFQDLFISHDAIVAEITDCEFYIQRYVGSNYLGSDADADLVTLLGWGTAASGGACMSMTPDSPWTVGTKFIAGWDHFANADGDISAPWPLSAGSIIIGSTPASDGIIPLGGEAHVQVSVDIPSSAGTTGYKAFSIVMAFSATS